MEWIDIHLETMISFGKLLRLSVVLKSAHTPNTTQSINAGLRLAHHLRCWSNFQPWLNECRVYRASTGAALGQCRVSIVDGGSTLGKHWEDLFCCEGFPDGKRRHGICFHFAPCGGAQALSRGFMWSHWADVLIRSWQEGFYSGAEAGSEFVWGRNVPVSLR